VKPSSQRGQITGRSSKTGNRKQGLKSIRSKNATHFNPACPEERVEAAWKFVRKHKNSRGTFGSRYIIVKHPRYGFLEFRAETSENFMRKGGLCILRSAGGIFVDLATDWNMDGKVDSENQNYVSFDTPNRISNQTIYNELLSYLIQGHPEVTSMTEEEATAAYYVDFKDRMQELGELRRWKEERQNMEASSIR
jgi:hypothetical protein